MRIALQTASAILALVTLPAGARAERLAHRFDFEERPLGNVEDLPMHWAKVAGPGLPHYVAGRLTADAARGGRYSFRIDLDGGSCAYQYDTHLLPVVVGGHYRATGYCRTTPLAHARGRLTLAVLDAAGTVLAEASSEPTVGDDWRPLATEVSADDPRAAVLRFRMELAQPARLGTAGPIAAEDVRGSAWFDDLLVAQTPRVSIATARPANVFRRGDAGGVSLVVTDPTTDDLTAQLVVSDAAGRQVFQRTDAVHAGADGRVTLPLPVTAAGWYRATVRLAAPAVDDAATASLAYVQLADDGGAAPPDRRFAVNTAELSPAAWPATLDVLPMLAVGRAKLAMDGPGVDAALDGMARRGIAAVGCLPVSDAVAPAVGRQAGHVDRWQIGADATDAFATDPAARATAARVATAAARLAGPFDLSVPCPFGADVPTASAVTTWLPSTVPADEVGMLLAGRGKGPRLTSVSIQPLPSDRPAADRGADLAERIVAALGAGVARVDVPSPVTDGVPVQPTDLFLVERTLLSALSGAACRGTVPLVDGGDAVLFERADGVGVAVLWSNGEDRVVPVPMGNDLVRTDLDGNVGPVGSHVVATRTPAILTGVDVPLLRFRAGMGLDRPAVDAVLLQTHVRRLHLTNPYAQPITGTVRLRGPAGWTVSPTSVPFSLAPGESLDREIGLDLPVNVRAGTNLLVADVQFDGVRLTVPLKIAVGLSDLSVESTATRDGPDGIVVQQKVTNFGNRPIDFVAYAACGGLPRVERSLATIAAGQTRLQRYRFRVGSTAPGPVRTGVRVADGTRALSEVVTVR